MVRLGFQMAIPELTAYGLLPHGVHPCTLQEAEAFLCSNDHRQAIWAGFEQFLEWTSHLPRPVSLLIDGSFVSNKALPNDIDLVVDITGCMPAAQAQWVEAWNGGFAHAKAAYNVDFYPFVVGAGNDFSAFFQYVRIEDALRRGISPATRKGLLKVSG